MAFVKDLSQVPWSVIDYFEDVEDILDVSNALFSEILDHHAPQERLKSGAVQIP